MVKYLLETPYETTILVYVTSHCNSKRGRVEGIRFDQQTREDLNTVL